MHYLLFISVARVKFCLSLAWVPYTPFVTCEWAFLSLRDAWTRIGSVLREFSGPREFAFFSLIRVILHLLTRDSWTNDSCGTGFSNFWTLVKSEWPANSLTTAVRMEDWELNSTQQLFNREELKSSLSHTRYLHMMLTVIPFSSQNDYRGFYAHGR